MKTSSVTTMSVTGVSQTAARLKGIQMSLHNSDDDEFETTEGLHIRIEHDDDPESPREWDNLGTMVCWHNRYNLGDEQPKLDPDEYLHELASRFDPKLPELHEPSLPDDIKERVQKVLDRHVVMIPLYLYDHSGITMRTHSFPDPWDSGQVGWIYATRDQILKEYSVTRLSQSVKKRAACLLIHEVEAYDQYLRGDVWGYIIEDSEGTHFDSCWGFYGYGYCEQAAEESLDYLLKQQEGDHTDVGKGAESLAGFECGG